MFHAVQSKAIETATDQVVGLMDFYQEQTRKVVDFWMEQNDAAVKEGKRLVKEWAATVTKTSSEFAGKMETTVKDAAEAIEPPKTTKAAKKA